MVETIVFGYLPVGSQTTKTDRLPHAGEKPSPPGGIRVAVLLLGGAVLQPANRPEGRLRRTMMPWLILLMILNAAYVSALPTPTVFYIANVLLHLVLGASVVVW